VALGDPSAESERRRKSRLGPAGRSKGPIGLLLLSTGVEVCCAAPGAISFSVCSILRKPSLEIGMEFFGVHATDFEVLLSTVGRCIPFACDLIYDDASVGAPGWL